MEQRESAGDQAARHQDETDQNPPFDGEALVVTDIDLRQAHQQVNGRHQRAQKVERLTNDGCAGDFFCGNAVAGRRLRDTRNIA